MRSLLDLMRLHRLQSVLDELAHELGGDADHPETLVAAAQSLRAALNRAMGYAGTPQDADGRSVAYSRIGR